MTATPMELPMAAAEPFVPRGGLRKYQDDAANAAMKEWEEVVSTLICMATGTGKTRTAAEVIRRKQPARVMWLAHREELIFQARDSIKNWTGLSVGIEMGDMMVADGQFTRPQVVVSTIQTQNSKNGQGLRRMGKFRPDDFDLMVVDESHHSVSPSYRDVINYYQQNKKLRTLHLTATPDRADEEALGQVIDSVAYEYEIRDAIRDGYLVDIRPMMVPVAGLDFSHIRTTAGDLNQGDLAAVMETESNIQGVVHPTLEIIFGLPQHTLDSIDPSQWGAYLNDTGRVPKQTLIFTVSVKQAENLCNIFNRVRPGLAMWVSGNTARDKRREMLISYKHKEFPILVNCMVASEGFDEPGIEVVVMARATKSRSLFSQMVGRGTRPLPGIVDGIDDAEGRREAINNSTKPELIVLDFVGNSGRHKLVSAADVLGGKVSDKVKQRALALTQKKGCSMLVAVDEAEEEERKEIERRRQQEEARKAKLVAKVHYSVKYVNPFDVLSMSPVQPRGWDRGKVLSSKQRALLQRQGMDPNMDYAQGKQVLNTLFARWSHNLCSIKQAELLKKYAWAIGRDRNDPALVNVTRDEASKLIDQVAAKLNWKKKGTT